MERRKRIYQNDCDCDFHSSGLLSQRRLLALHSTISPLTIGGL